MSNNSKGWKKEFDSEGRSSTYDKIISLFSLRRSERFKVLQAVLPEPSQTEFKILELGTGTGLLTELLVELFPDASVVTIEGAEKMMEQAKSKTVLQENEARIQWILADYSSPSWLKDVMPPFNLIVTFDSLHHLSHERKKELYKEIYDLTVKGGYFIISDHITSHGSFFDDPQYKLWIQEILDNLKNVEKGSDIAAIIEAAFSLSLRDLQQLSLPELHDIFTSRLKQEGDNPMPVMQHVDAMRNVGFNNIIIEYRYANYAIFSAKKYESHTNNYFASML